MELHLNKILKYEYVKFLLYLIIAFVVFSPSFINLNYFWDDERFLFLNPAFMNASSWTDFWIPGSYFYKSWPLGYSFFWLIVKWIPSAGFVFYKSLNIFIHTFNAYLTYRFVKKISVPYPYMLSLLFLVHPLHVESVSWIFQLMTILSYTFFITSLIFFSNFFNHGFKSYLIGALAFFLCSLLTKSYAILAPFLFVALFLIHKIKLKYYVLLIPFFICSLYLGLVNNRGTDILLNQNEKQSLANKLLHSVEKKFMTATEAQAQLKKLENEDPYFDYIFKKRLDKNPIRFDRGEVFSQGIWYYTSSLLLPLNSQYIHKAEKTHISLVVIALGFLILLPVLFNKKFKDKYFLYIPSFSLVLMLPYLGISFITFFYWSNVSDRYTYFFIIILVLFLGLILKNIRVKNAQLIIFSYFIILCGLNFNYGLKFNDNIKLYSEILTYKPHPGIYSLLIEQYLLKLDYEKADSVLKEALNRFPQDEKIKIDVIRVNSLKEFYRQF